jgi:NhaP-type Na+/H+ or K+/H+ antiporter
MATIVLSVGVLLFAASLFIALFRRTRIPDVLLLIGIGIALGPVTHTVTPEAFGAVGPALSTIALTVILFESGLSLQLAVLRQSLAATLRVTLLAFLSTMVIVAACGHVLLGLSWTLALALGAILGGTSSAVVIPMVRQLAVERVPATVLVLESAITDVLAIVVASAFLYAFVSGSASPLAIGRGVVASFAYAALIGGSSALLFLFAVKLVRRMPNAMVAVIAFVLVTYGVAETLGASGAIAALTLGFVLSNRVALGVTRLRPFNHVAGFREPRYVGWFLADVIFLLKTFFFLFLGISVRFTDWRLGVLALAVVIAIYAVRGVVVRVTMPAVTNRWDSSVMTVMGPKGLAAAVLAGVPVQMGIAQGDLMQQFTYMVVLASIVVTSMLVPQLTRGPMGALMGRVFGTYAPPPEAGGLLRPVNDDQDEESDQGVLGQSGVRARAGARVSE